MKYKHKRICKSLISLLLILAFMLAPFEGVFAAGGVNGEASTEDPGGVKAGLGSSQPPPLKGLAVTIGILEIDNTAQEYRSQIAAHNADLSEGSTDYWSEYRVSITDQFLYSHPEKMSQVAEMENQAIILLGQKADKNDGVDSKYRPIDEMSAHKNDGNYSRVYSASGKSSPGNFNIDVVYSSIKNNEALYTSFTDGKLTFDDINQLGVAGGKVADATDKFVRLWANAGTVDDCLNGIYDGLDQNSDTVWYDRALRYLDFLYVIDVLCGNTYDKLIDKYLRKLNRDESDTFVTVCAAVNAVMDLGDGRFYVATLPNYYAATGNGSFSDYQTFSVTGNFVDATNPESYSGSINSFVHTLQGKYDSNYPVGGGDYGSKLSGGNRVLWWWTDSDPTWGGYMGARVCQPTDINGNTSGNTGYTFLGCFTHEPVPPPPPDKGKDPDPDPDDGGDLDNDAYAKFYISASSDEYEVMPGDTVAARIDINLKQSAQMLYGLKLKWTANGIKYRDWDPSFGIALVREGGGSDIAVDTMTSNPSGSGGLDPTMQTSTLGGFTVMDVSWEEALEIFNGRKNVTVYDENVTINSDKEQRYVAVVNLYWFYDNANVESATAATMNFYSSGKEIVTEYQGADEVPWIVRKDDPNKGHFYSQLRDGNYVEMKDNSPGNGETYEAMAGVPTTENLYAGFGANEFMVNMNCELKSDTGMQRKYTLTYRVSECIGENKPCQKVCPGHENYDYAGGCGRVLVPGDPIAGTPDVVCDSGTGQRDYCTGGKITLVSRCSCGAGFSSRDYYPSPQHLVNDGSVGCVDVCFANDGHPHVHDFVLTVTQNINGYSYLDIVGTDIWQVTKLIVVGNKDLFSNPDQEKDPNTGYRAFVSQGPYSSGNGRIVFDWSLPKDTSGARSWGDTKELEEKGGHTLFVAGEAAARNWFTGELSGKQVKANVVSDYITLAITEGYQTITYNDQISQAANVVTDTNWGQKSINCSDVVGGSAQTEYSKSGVPVSFSETRTWLDLWGHEKEASLSNSTMGSYSAQKWESTQITRSGYNGRYDSPTAKWNNTNVFNSSGKDPAEQWETGSTTFTSENVGRQPNTQFDAHGEFVADGFSNTRMLISGFNIIDSTQKTAGESGVYSASDSVEPVSNGEWNTGNAWVYIVYAP